MKIVWIALGSVALLLILVAAIVWIAGSMLPQRHVVTRSAAYHATPEQLYSLIAGPQSWRPDVVTSEPVPGPSGRELLRETTRDGQTMTYEVTHRDPPRSLTRRIAGENLPFSGSWTYTIEPGEGGVTTVRITEDGEVYNPIFRFVAHYLLGETKTMDTYLYNLAKATNR